MKTRLIYLLILSFSLVSCEDVVDIDLQDGTTLYVADAFITNESKQQFIRLTTTASYFDNSFAPPIKGATVTVSGSDGSMYNFVENINGYYIWEPSFAGEKIDSIGANYTLNVSIGAELFLATSVLNPVPPIDSIAFEYDDEEKEDDDDGYTAEFYATDIADRVDFYWIKAFRNGKKVGDDGNFSLTDKDAAFGDLADDGKLFIFPLRVFTINESDTYYQINDSVRVELYSINEEIHEFLEAVSVQTNNGGLFATPPANVYGNIRDANNQPQKKMLGAFSISAVSKIRAIVTP
jgi:hypothetical protein